MPDGNPVGAANGSSSYLPITQIVRPPFDPVEQTLQDWYEMVQKEASRLAILLCRGREQMIEPFTYALREVIRNVFEHAGVSECYFCGQSWYNGVVEICIVDEGAGITSTLRESHEIESDGAALELAVMPGVSRVNRKSESFNFYDNSGFGLYVLSEVGAQYGMFALGSGTAVYTGVPEIRRVDPFDFCGTFFGLIINRPMDRFAEDLSRIIAAGNKAALEQGINVEASSVSRSTKITTV